MKKTPVSEFLRMRNHLRYLLHRITIEQNLIDAYSSEGWRKQSLEKIKPEKELQKAKSHILRYKLKIRDLFQRLDLSLTEGQIPESLFDSEGEIDSEDIFCAKCGSKDVSLDNDIILCDGSCERGFHQFCLEPPLQKEDIPQGNEGWLCPGCDCKVDCIDLLNDFNGVKLSVLDSWEKVFPEADAAATGKMLEDGSALPSDDSEDDDYDPDRTEVEEDLADQEKSSDESDYVSASNSSSGSPTKPGFPAKEHFMGLSSEDSEDDDFDPNAPDDDDDKVEDESSSDFTSDSEDLGAVIQDNTSEGDDQGQSKRVGEELEVDVRVNTRSLKDEMSYLLNSNESPISAKRHVERLDYKKLHDETYGNESSDSSDEDFEENVGNKRRKNVSGRISVKGSASAGKKSDIRPEDGDLEERRSVKQASKQFDTEYGNKYLTSHASSSEAGLGKRHRSKPHQKLGEAVTQRLFDSFKQNQYPKRPEKENLARDLGLSIQQVSKWFENARWSSRHSATMVSNGTSGSSRGQTSSLLAKDKLKNKGQVVDTEVVLSNDNSIAASPVTNLGVKLSQTVSVVVEPLVTEEPSEEKSGALKSRKRKNKKGNQPPSSCEKKFEGNSQVGSPDSERVRRSSRLQSN
ncbi:hypothetical protein Leryth_018997 [Lithospermum erythrorhizon]|nr:hypothetical protein Leryth_018997 [Lithospermum erythrorhizon]